MIIGKNIVGMRRPSILKVFPAPYNARIIENCYCLWTMILINRAFTFIMLLLTSCTSYEFGHWCCRDMNMLYLKYFWSKFGTKYALIISAQTAFISEVSTNFWIDMKDWNLYGVMQLSLWLRLLNNCLVHFIQTIVVHGIIYQIAHWRLPQCPVSIISLDTHTLSDARNHMKSSHI